MAWLLRWLVIPFNNKMAELVTYQVASGCVSARDVFFCVCFFDMRGSLATWSLWFSVPCGEQHASRMFAFPIFLPPTSVGPTHEHRACDPSAPPSKPLRPVATNNLKIRRIQTNALSANCTTLTVAQIVFVCEDACDWFQSRGIP